jgi:hypothetical protein
MFTSKDFLCPFLFKTSINSCLLFRGGTQCVNVRISKGENCKNNTNIKKFQGFQYYLSVPVLQYLQAVHFLSRFELCSCGTVGLMVLVVF